MLYMGLGTAIFHRAAQKGNTRLYVYVCVLVADAPQDSRADVYIQADSSEGISVQLARGLYSFASLSSLILPNPYIFTPVLISLPSSPRALVLHVYGEIYKKH